MDITDSMSHDPEWMHGDSDLMGGDDDLGSDNRDNVEYDDLGNPIFIATAAGFGHHMATDELEERELAESILKRRAEKQGKPVKVPLAHRRRKKGYVTPFGRWATMVNKDPSRTKEGIPYTMEEQLQIIRAQGD